MKSNNAHLNPWTITLTRGTTVLRTSLMLVLLGLSIVAANAAPARTPAGCNTREYRQFDFWLGDWDTFDPGDSTTSVARTHVDLIATGCALHELYEQTDGLIGDSILSFDPVRKLWQQTWVTNYGSLLVIAGRFKDGVLSMEGTANLHNGTSLLQRITWKTEGSGVRESSTISKDGGKTWEPSFDVLFKKHH
jgi:hypothetical protein